MRCLSFCHRTLIDSTPGVLKAWQTFARDYNLDAAQVAHASHGRRLYDTLKEYCHIVDEAKLEVIRLRLRRTIPLISLSSPVRNCTIRERGDRRGTHCPPGRVVTIAAGVNALALPSVRRR